jgi:hypothetical protein
MITRSGAEVEPPAIIWEVGFPVRPGGGPPPRPGGEPEGKGG